ncbi:MAG: hypothetical protein CO094_01995 [Anaerolineae bacterium CG_4_9_14_3_um_filter_57_17]|nr:GNAT family N-acetyltransferase [bacterium]NCT21473.1 GNAT family N-acetyltransferase [bacterium]OIO86576.1 MAG: hypothetical protein AUK01_02680 [Anaerolineae bacterium CG2_30_57_67]PJB68207.1 MAG: hypothetical protein CO094_01995 [Anaerolineae bacterium CG_4_9_14_3_um_filter_57_17]
MSIHFSPMTDQDFAAFLRKSIPEYAYDQMRAGNWASNEAMQRAQKEFQQMLPNGPQTPGQHLLVILDDNDSKVGMCWYFVDENRARKTTFLIDLFFLPEGRHKNYEAESFALLEEMARKDGVKRIELQVFTHKAEEIAMYRQNGFGETSIFFAKDLKPGSNVS